MSSNEFFINRAVIKNISVDTRPWVKLSKPHKIQIKMPWPRSEKRKVKER